MKRVGYSLTIAVVAVVLTGALVAKVLSAYDWNPTLFTGFGREATGMTEYGESQITYEVILRDNFGHDGKAYFALANDPLLLHPEVHLVSLDRARYRAQRIFYPMLVSAGGLLGPMATIWTLIAVNVLAIGLGTFAVAQLAVSLGASPIWGLSFALNIGFISELIIDGAGIVAAAAAFGAILALRRNHLVAGVTFLSAAALSREVMLIVAAGGAVWLWSQGRRRAPLATMMIPLAVVAGWWFYVRERLGSLPSTSQFQEVGAPFLGLVSAVESWLESPLDLAAGVAVIVVLILFLRRALASREELLGWAFLGFVPLAFLLTEQVWLSYFDITRATAPVITAFLLLAFAYKGSLAEECGLATEDAGSGPSNDSSFGSS